MLKNLLNWIEDRTGLFGAFRAFADEDCICLAVLDAPLRFTGWKHRWMNPFLRLQGGEMPLGPPMGAQAGLPARAAAWGTLRALPESERAAYVADMRETMTLAADALVDFVDFKQAWTKPAIEDPRRVAG